MAVLRVLLHVVFLAGLAVRERLMPARLDATTR